MKRKGSVGNGGRAQQDGVAQPPVAAPAPSAPCNTDGATCKLLGNRIDSLYLSFPGELSETGVIQLDIARTAARGDKEIDRALAQVSVLDHLFEAGASAGKHFKYSLQDHAFFIRLKSKKSKQLPLAVCQISSDYLVAVGVEQAVSELRLILSNFGVISGAPNVSRIDLCVDFVTSTDIDSLDVKAWVTRARYKGKHWVGDIPSGWSIGEGDLMGRLYNKVLEINKSGKTYLHGIWAEQGWNGIDPVWRMEFQFRNPVLKELGCSTYPSVLEYLSAIWVYASASWLRLTVPSVDDKTQTRWPLHSLWANLQAVSWEGKIEASRIPLKLGRVPTNEKLYQSFVASLTSFMAARGISDAETAVHRLLEEAQRYFDDLAENAHVPLEMAKRGELVREGFSGYVMTRAARKAMTYNIPYPHYTQMAKDIQLQAVADAYRKQSDGE